MEEKLQRPSSLEVGSLSADGSRIWTGRFWALNPAHTPAEVFTHPVDRLPEHYRPQEQRSFGCGGVIAAALLGVVLENFHFTLPYSGSLESAVSYMLMANTVYGLISFGIVVLILSAGRQGIDVLVLRCMLVGFALGAGFIGLTGLLLFQDARWLLAILAGGLIYAVGYGLVIAAFALLANLLWYRSFHALRPQLGIFNRRSRAAGQAS